MREREMKNRNLFGLKFLEQGLRRGGGGGIAGAETDVHHPFGAARNPPQFPLLT